VGGAAIEVEFEFAEAGFGNDDGGFGQGDLAAVLAGGVGEKHAVPAGATGGNVVDVENGMREMLVKDARLNEIGDLRSNQRGFGVAASAEGSGSKPEGHEKGEAGAEKRKEADGNEDAAAGDAKGSEGDDFGVHGHATEPEKDADENGHGNGEDENTGNDAEEEGEYLGARTGMADKNLHEANELGDEEDKGEDDETEECVTDDFAGDVAVENAHGARGECSTAENGGR